MAEIMGSIKRHRYAMEALLAEYRDKTAELEQIDYLGDPTADLSDLRYELNTHEIGKMFKIRFSISRRRRQSDDNGSSPGSMCASIIRYARPQKARSATGEWKVGMNHLNIICVSKNEIGSLLFTFFNNFTDTHSIVHRQHR